MSLSYLRLSWACECSLALLCSGGSKWPCETNHSWLSVGGSDRVGAFGSYSKPGTWGISRIQSSTFSMISPSGWGGQGRYTSSLRTNWLGCRGFGSWVSPLAYEPEACAPGATRTGSVLDNLLFCWLISTCKIQKQSVRWHRNKRNFNFINWTL